MTFSLSASIPTALKARCARITRSRTTVIFFLFALANYAAQTAIHIGIFLCFSRNITLVDRAIEDAGVRRGFPIFRNGLLQICYGIPGVDGTQCITVHGSPTFHVPTSALVQSMQCAEGLTWLDAYLCDARSEEVFCLLLETWFLVISFLALTNESTPNLIIVLFAQVVNLGWISYRLSNDIAAKRIYDEIIIGETCRGVDLLRGSWEQSKFAIALYGSIAAVSVTSFFVYKLVKLYSKGTLSSVGSTPVIDRMLKWRLWMRVFLQMTAFLVLASAAMWYDKRISGMVAPYSENTLYDVGFYVVAIIVLPWLALGENSVSKENRGQFFVHAVMSVVLLLVSALWFASALFRYQYVAWHCFAGVTTSADVLLIITCVISVVCRLNFGKGLAHFLVVEKSLRAAGFTPDVFEHNPDGMKQVSMSHRRDSSCRSDIPLTHTPSNTSKQLKRACSVQSSVLATWLPSLNGRNEKKGSLQAEIPTDVVVISKETMKPRGPPMPSISDADDDDESIESLA